MLISMIVFFLLNIHAYGHGTQNNEKEPYPITQPYQTLNENTTQQEMAFNNPNAVFCPFCDTPGYNPPLACDFCGYSRGLGTGNASLDNGIIIVMVFSIAYIIILYLCVRLKKQILNPSRHNGTSQT